jgi:transcription termination factor NusB
MSLVGKELEVSFADGTADTDDVSSTDDDAHRPVSPQSGFESLFLGSLRTNHISANALATELRRSNRSLRSGSTVATDDFVSAFDNYDDLVKFQNDFAKEAPTSLSKHPIYEYEEDPKMSSTTTTVEKVDAASHVYEGVKTAWGWGKEQAVISTLLGITEAIAVKVVSVIGTDLEEIDNNIKPQLVNLDSSILNPALKAILTVIMNAAGKSEDFVKPIVVSILKPMGLIKDKETVAPELTNPGPAASTAY